MDVNVLSTKPYDRPFMDAAAGGHHKLTYLEACLSPNTEVFARAARAVRAFVNDKVSEAVLLKFIDTLHCPLTPQTRQVIDATAIVRMKRSAMLINSSHGTVIDTRAVIERVNFKSFGKAGHPLHDVT